MLRKLVPAIVATALVATGCGAPPRKAGVDVRTINSDIGLGVKINEATGLPTSSAYVFGGDLDFDFDSLSSRPPRVLGFQQTQHITQEFCPDPVALDVAEKPVSFTPEGLPEAGTYLWRLWATYKRDGKDVEVGPLYFYREVASARSAGTTSEYTIQVDTFGQSATAQQVFYIIEKPPTQQNESTTNTDVNPGASQGGASVSGQGAEVEDKDPDAAKPDNIPKNAPKLAPSQAPNQPTPAIPNPDSTPVPGTEQRFATSGHNLSQRAYFFKGDDGSNQYTRSAYQPRLQLSSYPIEPGQRFNQTVNSLDTRAQSPVEIPNPQAPRVPSGTPDPSRVSPDDDRRETLEHKSATQRHRTFDGCGQRFYAAYAEGTQKLTIDDKKFPKQNGTFEYKYRYGFSPQYGSLHVHDEIEFDPAKVAPGQPYKITETLGRIKPVKTPQAP